MANGYHPVHYRYPKTDDGIVPQIPLGHPNGHFQNYVGYYATNLQILLLVRHDHSKARLGIHHGTYMVVRI